MEKVYNFKDFEKNIDSVWNSNHAFSPDRNRATPSEKENPFVIVIPPPNVTGVLHMGHGLNNNIQDVLARYYRMQGRTVLWVPGSDHAGIATQQVMERTLKAQNIDKFDLGRDAFIERTWDLAMDHKKTIVQQLHSLGASCDWTKERFTLDEGLSDAVREVFVSLYERGLIYRGDYLVNWSVDAGTALSDDEVVYQEVQGTLYHIRYPFVDNKVQGEVIVATTRPETMFGDTAVAVHPKDTRRAGFVGKKLKLPLTDREVTVIADEYVDMEFGTGAVKITPAHDHNDYAIAKRHSLEYINILNTDGTLNNNVPELYRGLSVQDARKKAVVALESQGYLVAQEPHVHKVGHCYRTHCVVEPIISTQWFVKMGDMAQKALHALENGDIRFYPKHWGNTYVHWLKNIKDWCISRQLWWGHRIPVWYNDDTGEVIVSRTDPTKSPEYAGMKLRQDEDVLDTWFSSWLWPFSVLGWPEKTEDLEKFYPTTTLVTAYDIIFFWIARMIMAGLEFTGQVPFRDIYIHGLIRDSKGRKMSKSLGNGIDPLQVIDEYGADALKFTLTFMCKLGGDVLLNHNDFQLGSKFANKVWNASRFLLMNLENTEYATIDTLALSSVDTWMLSRMSKTVDAISSAMRQYRLDDAAKVVYEYFWTDFCDWYIECVKPSLYSPDPQEKQRASAVLLWILTENLVLLHPFLPFITEEIYRHIGDKVASVRDAKGLLLINAQYPRAALIQKSLERYKDGLEGRLSAFGIFQEIVTGIRTLRSKISLSPKLAISCRLYVHASPTSRVLRDYFLAQKDTCSLLIGADKIEILEAPVPKEDNGVGVEGRSCTAMVDIKELIDIPKEIAQLTAKKEKLKTQCERTGAQLENKEFMARAKPEYIADITRQHDDLKDKIVQIENFIRNLQHSV